MTDKNFNRLVEFITTVVISVLFYCAWVYHWVGTMCWFAACVFVSILKQGR